MSIGKRVSEAIDKMQAGDPESALFAICAAIEATAAKELGRTGRSTYKTFIHDNLAIITQVAFTRRVMNLHVAFDHSSQSIKTGPNGECSVEDIFYHAVRCGLYHSAELPLNLRFIDEKKISCEGGVLHLPSALIYGLITAVVIAPVNRDEVANASPMFNWGSGFRIPVSLLWGRRAEFQWLLDVEMESLRIQAEKSSAPSKY